MPPRNGQPSRSHPWAACARLLPVLVTLPSPPQDSPRECPFAPNDGIALGGWGGVGTDGSTGNCCVSHSPFFVCFHKSRKALLAPTRPPARPSVHIGWSRHRGVGWKCC